ncbi:hypothetical protein [Cellulomonas sp. Y8]|uniref:hypothetical protein n=1 Tax=Cellulomonas sp. Y8 TaxID=2591145 RepID=UPI0011C6F4DB|nr:hypothetical protein [Cellulomonas sp. Y8]
MGREAATGGSLRGQDSQRARRVLDVPTVLVLLGLAAKVLISVTVDETLGTWVGSALAFAGTVMFSVSSWSAWRRASVLEEEPRREEPPRTDQDPHRDRPPGRD